MCDIERCSIEQTKLKRLESVLKQSFWNFSVGYNSFDGISEGICIMIGIFPEGSMQTQDEYGPRFLPGGLKNFGFDVSPKRSEQLLLRKLVRERADYLSQVGLSGLMPVKESMEAFAKIEVSPPWLAVANSKVRYAKRIPAKLISNPDVREKVEHKHRSNGGRARAQKNQITRIIEDDVFLIFCELRESNFEGCCANRSGRPLATRIAERILEELELRLRQREVDQSRIRRDDWSPVVPQKTTVEQNVRKWLKKTRSAKN